jgi:hypothetical protein
LATCWDSVLAPRSFGVFHLVAAQGLVHLHQVVTSDARKKRWSSAANHGAGQQAVGT